VFIQEPDSLYVLSTINPVQCTQQPGSIDITVFGGVSPYDYLWSTGDTIPDINNLMSQIYNLTIEDQNGCILLSSFDIPNNGQINLDITQTNYNRCYGDEDAGLLATSTNAILPHTYLWSNFITGPVNINLPAGEYFVNLTDAWGCEAVDSIIVTEPEILDIQVNSEDIACRGGFTGSASVVIDGGTPAYTVLWQDGATTLTTTGLGTGEIWVTVTDANSCVESAHSVISEPPTGLEVGMNIKQVTCFGAEDGSINAFASGGSPPYVYNWNINGTIMEGSTIRNIGVGVYYLTVFDSNGCRIDAAGQIYIVNSLVATAIVGNTSCTNNSDGYISITAQGGTEPYSYYWMDMRWDTHIIDSLYQGEYYFTIRDSNNCEYNLGPIVILDGDRDCLRIPAAFSPNGDGYNDEFEIENIHLYPRAVIQIFNRWGQLLYEDLAINGFWDGKYNDKPVPSGAYLYNIILNVNDDPRVGTVTVIR
jgi:gliding motility-associated-like protein